RDADEGLARPRDQRDLRGRLLARGDLEGVDLDEIVLGLDPRRVRARRQVLDLEDAVGARHHVAARRAAELHARAADRAAVGGDRAAHRADARQRLELAAHLDVAARLRDGPGAGAVVILG